MCCYQTTLPEIAGLALEEDLSTATLLALKDQFGQHTQHNLFAIPDSEALRCHYPSAEAMHFAFKVGELIQLKAYLSLLKNKYPGSMQLLRHKDWEAFSRRLGLQHSKPVVSAALASSYIYHSGCMSLLETA